MLRMKQCTLWVIAMIGLLTLAYQQSRAETLFEEHFNTDVIGSGSWIASDASVSVDVANGWLRIGNDGAVNDFADKFGPFQLPLVIEWRERTFNGEGYFSLPKLEFWWGPSSNDSYHITYVQSNPYSTDGWLLGHPWTNIHTLGATSWNQWRTVKAIIRSDGGELFAKQDGDLDFTPIATATWAIPNVIERFRLSQHSDDVSDFDYVKVTSYENTGWCDDFESYTAGSFPSPSWTYTGNSAISVDNSTAYSGSKSLKAFGVIGGCWGAIPVHPLNATFPITVEVAIRNGAEDLSGCIPFRASLGIGTGPEWTDGPFVSGFTVLENGDFEAEVSSTHTVLTNLAPNTWHSTRIEYTNPGDGQLHGRYFVNGTDYGDFTVPWEPWMQNLGYLHLGASEGTVWFDDVCVSSIPPASGGTATIQPNPQYVYYSFAIEPLTVTICIGNFTCGYTADDVETSTLLINGTIHPTATIIGEELCLTFPLPQFIRPYGELYDTTLQTYTVTGNLNDGVPLSIDGEVTIIGKSSLNPSQYIVPPGEIVLRADCNRSGIVNISDVIYLIAFIFNGGETPKLHLLADANCSMSVNVADVVYLVKFIFSGGPAPCPVS